jgi:hypothetical protein
VPNSTMPRCGPPMDGQVFCNSGMLYECEFISPNSMERRTGWRWKSDILRSCPEPDHVRTAERPFVLPQGCGAPQGGPSGAGASQTDAGASTAAGTRTGTRAGTGVGTGTGGQTQVQTMHVRPSGCPGLGVPW